MSKLEVAAKDSKRAVAALASNGEDANITSMSDIQLEQLNSALLERYVLSREVGHGGMATVFLGRDLKHQRDVALKVFRPEIAAAVGHDRFRREIDLAANLSHPHILPLHDSGEADDLLLDRKSVV